MCDVVGAGDALVAGYVYGMLLGGEIEPALFGLAAASLTVETDQTVAAQLSPGLLRQRIASQARLGSTHARKSVS